MSYAPQIASALRLIKSKGTVFVLKRVTQTFDPITSAPSAGVKVEGNIDAVLLNVGQSAWREFDDQLQEALRKGRLRKFLIAGGSAPFQPQPNDFIVDGGNTYTIRAGKSLNPDGGAFILHTCIAELGAISAVDAAATIAP